MSPVLESRRMIRRLMARIPMSANTTTGLVSPAGRRTPSIEAIEIHGVAGADPREKWLTSVPTAPAVPASDSVQMAGSTSPYSVA